MKHFALSFISMLCVAYAGAAVLTPESALRRAIEPQPQVKTLAVSAPEAYNHVYTGQNTSYYIFDKSTGGYIVVSADDNYPALLADIAGGSFSPDSIAPGAKWILEEYAAAISSSRAASTSASLADLYGQWTAIAPLVKTKWNQSWPYNIMCPTKNGINCLTGCVATALSQIIRTIGYAKGAGYRTNTSCDEPVSFDYASHDFNFDIMPNEPSINDSEEDINAVASLMLACGLAVNMNYDTDASGARSENVPSALIDNFGYSSEYTRHVKRQKYNVVQWESMLYRELSLGRPVYYSGAASSSAHAFVIDGYAPAGQWHVNWGWGGMSDGYFNLSLLSPSLQGIGGSTSSDGYNSSQAMVFAVKPGDEPGLMIGVAGKTYVNDDGTTMSFYYTSLSDMFTDLSLGAIVTDGEGLREMGSFTFWQHQSLSTSSTIRSNNITLDIPSLSLPAGEYRIYPAYALGESESLIISAESDGQPYINLTVDADGTYKLSNCDYEQGNAELMISEVIGAPLHSGYSVGLRVIIVNNGNADYKGNVYADILSNNNSDTVIRRTTASDVSIAGGTNIDIVFSIAGVDASGIPIPAGKYQLRFSDSKGEEIANCLWDIDFVTGAPATYQETRNDISIHNAENISTKVIVGDTWTHVPDVFVNNELKSGELCVTFYRPGTNVQIKTYTVKEAPISRRNGMMTVKAFNIDVPVGLYEVCYTYARTQVSGRQTMGVGTEVDGLFFVPTSSDQVMLIATPTDLYSGNIVVPETIEVDGTTYKVTSIDESAFSSCIDLLSVQIPKTVKTIGRNAFAYCRGVENIVMMSDELPFCTRNHAMPGMSEQANIYVKSTVFDDYQSLLAEYQQVYAAIESISSIADTIDTAEHQIQLAIHPAHPSINPIFAVVMDMDNTYNATTTPNPAATIEIASVDNGMINLNVTAHHSGSVKYLLQSPQPGVVPAEIMIEVPTSTGIDEINSDSADAPDQWFDLQGRSILYPEKVAKGTILIHRKGAATTKVLK